jgi:hypothetical protein
VDLSHVPAALPPDDFLSGTSGLVSGIRATTRALITDAYADAVALWRGDRRRLREAAAAWPRRSILVLAVERADQPNLLREAHAELLRSHHMVSFQSKTTDGLGKFENLNELLANQSAKDYDWLLVLDDDVALPARFLDLFVFLVERFELRLAQPAHRARSHAAWQITRRRAGSLVRETPYVEIGPVVAFHRDTFDELLPFPPLRTGWGLDVHWAAVARDRNWRMGIVDATPIRHGLRLTASHYDREQAIDEARRFLAERPYISAAEAQRTLVTHRSWR